MTGRTVSHRRLVSLLAALALLACEGAKVTVVGPLTPGSGGGTGQPAFTITLTPPSAVLSIGSSTTITGVVRDSLGTVVPGAVLTWISGNAGVATVTAGVVTGVAAGTVSIGASYSGATATASILVVTIPVASVQVIPAFDTLQRGTSLQLTAVPKDANGLALIGRTVSWQSNNTPVAGVNGTGLVSASAVGTATITAISEGQLGTSAITVVNIPVATVTVAPLTGTVYVGRTLALAATTQDSGGNVLTGRLVTWSSSAPTVASVNTNGVVTGVAPGGPVTITATSEGQTGIAAITVTLVPVASVSVLPATASVTAGATITLTATPRDSSGTALTGRPITWATSDSAVARVGPTGVVTGVTPGGPVVMTATTGGVSGAANVTVTVPPPTLVRVVLTPDTDTLNPSSTRAFAVQGKMSDSSLQAISVTFTAAGGSISQGGLYTAGPTPGTFNVVARVQSGTLADTSRVTIVVAPPPPVATVTVTPGSATISVGATQLLTATTRDAGNNILTGRVISWSSSDTTIARVNGNGVVTGVAVGGPVTITATSEGQVGAATVTVIIVPVATVQVSPVTASVQVGATTQLTATTRDAGGNILTGRVITWATANGGIAGVNSVGVVNGVAAGGPIAITATSEGKSASSNVTVTGSTPTLVRVILLPDTATVLVGQTKQFIAQGKMSDSSIVAISVTFAAAGGTISQAGAYTAGSGIGVFNVIATAQGQPKADTSRVSIVAAPPPGSYTIVAGDDWSSYASTAALIANAGFYPAGTSTPISILNTTLALVPDPIFGQVARILQPESESSGSQSPGLTISYTKSYPTTLDRHWFRFRVRFSPGWTTAGLYPTGAANSYKLAFVLWQNANGRAEVEFTNGTAYFPGFDYGATVSCTNVLMPGSPSNWGQVTTEWSSGEWWEYILYYEKTGTVNSQHRWWRRQLTQGGAIVSNAFIFIGTTRQNCSSATPPVRGITLGANKNKSTPADQYIYWGPWEAVNGSVYPNPWGVGP